MMNCELMMKNERKKRVLPRHIMSAVVQDGIIPYHVIRSMLTSNGEKAFLDSIIADGKLLT